MIMTMATAPVFLPVTVKRRVSYFTDNIEAGIVDINIPLPMPVFCHSFAAGNGLYSATLYAYGPDAFVALAVKWRARRRFLYLSWPDIYFSIPPVQRKRVKD